MIFKVCKNMKVCVFSGVFFCLGEKTHRDKLFTIYFRIVSLSKSSLFDMAVAQKKDEEFHIYSTSFSFSNNSVDYVIGSNRWAVTVV